MPKARKLIRYVPTNLRELCNGTPHIYAATEAHNRCAGDDLLRTRLLSATPVGLHAGSVVVAMVVHAYQQFIHNGPLPEGARVQVDTVLIREPDYPGDPGLYHTTFMLVSGDE